MFHGEIKIALSYEFRSTLMNLDDFVQVQADLVLHFKIYAAIQRLVGA